MPGLFLTPFISFFQNFLTFWFLPNTSFFFFCSLASDLLAALLTALWSDRQQVEGVRCQNRDDTQNTYVVLFDGCQRRAIQKPALVKEREIPTFFIQPGTSIKGLC